MTSPFTSQRLADYLGALHARPVREVRVTRPHLIGNVLDAPRFDPARANDYCA